MEKLKILIVIIGFYSFALFANQKNHKLIYSSSKQLKHGWTKVIEQWGISNSGHITTKIILTNRDGELVKEFYYNNDHDFDDPFGNETIINYIVTNDKILISKYKTNLDSSLRHWEFEILNSESELVYFEEFFYETPYNSFRLNTVMETHNINRTPYFFAVDDMYLYYINEDFTAIKKKEIKFKDVHINREMMPTPMEIEYNNNTLDILYEFPTILSSDSEISSTVRIDLSN